MARAFRGAEHEPMCIAGRQSILLCENRRAQNSSAVANSAIKLMLSVEAADAHLYGCFMRAELVKHGSASGCTFTEPAKGRSIATITKSPAKINRDSMPVISVCTTTFCVPKKNVKLIVRPAPANSTSQTTPGTVPAAVTSLSRRAVGRRRAGATLRSTARRRAGRRDVRRELLHRRGPTLADMRAVAAPLHRRPIFVNHRAAVGEIPAEGLSGVLVESA